MIHLTYDSIVLKAFISFTSKVVSILKSFDQLIKHLIMNSSDYQSIGFSKSDLTLKSELRHLPIKDRIQLASLLDANHNWKLLAGCIPKPDGDVGPLLNTSHINILEDLIRQGISPTQALFDYWVTNPFVFDLDYKLSHS